MLLFIHEVNTKKVPNYTKSSQVFYKCVHCNLFLIDINITDEGQRKRKVEAQEETPAKRKSVEYGDVPVAGEAADMTATALQNLTIPDTDEKQETVVTTTGLSSSSGTSECSPEKVSNNGCQPSATGKAHLFQNV